jgi:hypothetical protein
MATPLQDPRNQALGQALGRSEPLVGLLQRVRASRDRFNAIAPLLPASLRDSVRPGPLDDTAWTVLVDHAAGAAKLRQMLPALQATLTDVGWAAPAIKIKIQPRA